MVSEIKCSQLSEPTRPPAQPAGILLASHKLAWWCCAIQGGWGVGTGRAVPCRAVPTHPSTKRVNCEASHDSEGEGPNARLLWAGSARLMAARVDVDPGKGGGAGTYPPPLPSVYHELEEWQKLLCTLVLES